METKYRRRFGDRSDGRRVRSISPMSKVSPYIMEIRAGSQNFMRDSIDMEKIDQYINEKRSEGMLHFSVMHVLIAAYMRMASQRPGVNRFLSGQRVYARNNFEIILNIKKEMSLNSPDTVIKVELKPDCVAADVYEKFEKTISDYRNDPGGGFDDTAKFLNYMPGLVLRFTVRTLRILDYFGLLPRFLTKISPFHGSFFITSMGSLGIPPIYHHLYDFGNVPVFCSFGAKRFQYETQADGSVLRKKYVDITFVTDERICDGYYFASALKLMKHYLRNPWCLDQKPETVIEDIP